MNVIVILGLICVLVDGMVAGLAFSQFRTGDAIIWSLLGVVSGVLICLWVF